MKIRDIENVLRYRRIPYPKRSVELIAIIAISCTFFLFMHTKNLNTRLREMEVKLQPSELSALGLLGEHHLSGGDIRHSDDINTLHGTYQFLKSTGQIFNLNIDKLNNTRNAEMDIVVFNRVPKTGSVQLIELMKKLSKIHGYEITVDPQKGGIRVFLNENQEEELIDDIANMQEPVVFVSHINYMNFSKYEQPRPIYINLVRDPVERIISWFYYVRSPWIFVPQRKLSNRDMPSPSWVNLDYDQCVREQHKTCAYIEGSDLEKVGDHRRQTLFFCGHNTKKCMPFNAKMPLQLAKRNVEKEYAVIGTWEDTNITLTVLEKYIPKYFKGAHQIYYMGLYAERQNSNPMKPHIADDIKNMVRKNFTREIEFYQFCRQRLHKQYLALKLDEIMSFDRSLSKETRQIQ